MNGEGQDRLRRGETLARYAARAQGSILDEVDHVTDSQVRDRIRRSVLDQIELFQRRVDALLAGETEGMP